MLKTTVSLQVLAANEINSIEGGDESIEKYGKLSIIKKSSKSQKSSKTRKLSKSQKLSKTGKLSKFQKLVKSRKELLKSKNLPNFNAKENKPSFLILDARTAFNHLWLAFTKASIF